MNGFDVQSEVDAMMERQKKDIMPGVITTPKTPHTPRNNRYENVIKTPHLDKIDHIIFFILHQDLKKTWEIPLFRVQNCKIEKYDWIVTEVYINFVFFQGILIQFCLHFIWNVADFF